MLTAEVNSSQMSLRKHKAGEAKPPTPGGERPLSDSFFPGTALTQFQTSPNSPLLFPPAVVAWRWAAALHGDGENTIRPTQIQSGPGNCIPSCHKAIPQRQAFVHSSITSLMIFQARFSSWCYPSHCIFMLSISPTYYLCKLRAHLANTRKLHKEWLSQADACLKNTKTPPKPT